ncbi:DUF2804 domain-containing protein [Capillimicrobium parvum]|uniref:DUF2804 domain-containing protein n=1 Tax=Capillimicrobium parvum TaxID=2884022 RepID=A0A9E6Y1B6_9ACTN|nr:DUF2804 domain-containing protein [Capillimicrobium parvum]UGS38110.1 hypothetical protein DSM104329_04533 [Capillimicrobium parvum]
MLPWRTEDHSSARPVDLGNLPARREGRALKRWRYVGVFGPERMLCVGLAHVGGVPQAWWAVWDRGAGSLRERTIFARPRAIVRFGHGPGRVTVRDRDVRIDLELDEGRGVETVCPHGGGTGWIWTRKQAGIAARGSVRLGERAFAVDGLAVVDDTAGYHARHTAWRWSAGVGRTADGQVAGWNLVSGVNDPPHDSERTVWLDGAPREAGPCTFADDLSAVRTADGGDLAFRAEATRERHDELLLVRSDYRQPFGTFSGVLPGGAGLAEGFGVMEDHRARW